MWATEREDAASLGNNNAFSNFMHTANIYSELYSVMERAGSKEKESVVSPPKGV